MNLLCDLPRKVPILVRPKISMELIELLDEVLVDLLLLSLHEQLLVPCELILEEVFVNLLHGVESYE